ncbi:MAG TPA: hypothetical protein PKE56_05060 [Acidimicrobiales bacterium]|jgi:hypothetical protein|nr:hypothetical protein [Acidimicrobiales bacterium]
MGWIRNRRATRASDDDWEARVLAAAERRKAHLVGQEHIVAYLEELLFRHDPIGLNFEDNTDEYLAEAESICLRRHEARTPEDLQHIMREEFVHWFDERLAGPADRYRPIAEEAWQILHSDE